jgi:hypothetical protein
MALAALTGCTSDDGSPAATATATRPPTAGATVTATTLPPVDGTVDPLGFGGTDPVVLKSNPDPISGAATLRAVRVGSHPEQGGWDRIVFEFADVRPAGQVRYAPQAVQCGSGMNVPLPGTAVLLVEFEPANAHTEAGQPTVINRTIGGPGRAILGATQICDFEAHVDWALGLVSQQRFKVTTLSNPTRVVIDIKWP